MNNKIGLIKNRYNEILINNHLYINLEKRKIRRDQCEHQLKTIGLKPNRLKAIEDKIPAPS